MASLWSRGHQFRSSVSGRVVGKSIKSQASRCGNRCKGIQRPSRRDFATRQREVFDLQAKKAHRARIASQYPDGDYDYLKDEVARRLTDRLNDVSPQKSFPQALDMGALSGHVRKAIVDYTANNKGIKNFRQLEMSEELLNRDRGQHHPAGVNVTYELWDEETRLPVEDDSQDVVFSSMSLHWINDLPGVFKEAYRVLKPDGVFLGAMLGGETLQELRSSLAIAEQERYGGVSPHLSPFVKDSEIGGLIQGAGFNLPTADSDLLTVRYPDMFTMMEHLRGMGETNATFIRRSYTSKEAFLAAASAYQELYTDEDGLLEATFHVIYVIGWKPHPSQQQPDSRGSASTRLSTTLEELAKGPLSPGNNPAAPFPPRD
mmetsp:Transcript_19081/g.26683  ORF Transcript_19081/g.26683 Transcript_19081/m.26683 type:complete len:374 (+) Transcript_19081:3-1124(+)